MAGVAPAESAGNPLAPRNLIIALDARIENTVHEGFASLRARYCAKLRQLPSSYYSSGQLQSRTPQNPAGTVFPSLPAARMMEVSGAKDEPKILWKLPHLHQHQGDGLPAGSRMLVSPQLNQPLASGETISNRSKSRWQHTSTGRTAGVRQPRLMRTGFGQNVSSSTSVAPVVWR